MAFVDKTNTNSQADEIAGANPLGAGGGGVPLNAPDNSPSEATGASTLQAQAQPDSQVATTNKKAPSASSGTFTNIQKYVDKNKPQASKMAGAVAGDVSKQAESIRKSVEGKQQQQQELLKANTNTMDQGMGFAKTQVDNIVNAPVQTQAPAVEGVEPTPAPEPYTPSEADMTRFQELSSGNIQGLQQVNDLNVAKDNVNARALQGLAQGANTEQGRRNLLDQTFQKQGDYTRGMSGLDNLITSGDEGARNQLIQGTQQVSGDLGRDITSMVGQSQAATGLQNQNIGNYGSQVQDLVNNPLSEQDTLITSAYDQELLNRTNLLNPESEEYKNAILAAQSGLDAKKASLTGKSYVDMLREMIPQAYKRAGQYNVDEGDASTTNLQNYVNALDEFNTTGKVFRRDPYTGEIKMKENYKGSNYGSKTYSPVELEGDAAQAYLDSGGGVRTSHHKNRMAMRSLIDLVNEQMGTDQDLYGSSTGARNDFGEKGSNYAKEIANLSNFYSNQYNSLGSGEDVVQKRLSQLGGNSFADLSSGKDINKYDVASDDQINMINNLKKLSGKQDLITDDQYDNKFTSYDDIKELMSRYDKSGTNSDFAAVKPSSTRRGEN